METVYCEVCGIALCKTCDGHEQGGYNSDLVDQAYTMHAEDGAEEPQVCSCYE